MRLIDADELKTLSYEVLVYTGNPNRVDGLSAYNGLVEDDIDLAPTVEAIPISWLLKKMQYDISNLDTITVIKIGRLIREWRKEND